MRKSISAAPPPSHQNPKRRRKWILLACLIFVGVPGGAWGILWIQGEVELRAGIAEIEGLEPDGWKLEDMLARRRTITDIENSSLTILAAAQILPDRWPLWPLPAGIDEERHGTVAQKLRSEIATGLVILSPAEQIHDVPLRSLRAELDRSRQALTTALRLVDQHEGQYDTDWTQDFLFRPEGFKYDNAVIKICDLLGYEASLRTQDRNIDGVLLVCRAMVNVGQSMANDMDVGPLLIRLNLRARLLRVLERVAGHGELAKPQLAQFQEILAKELGHADFLKVLRIYRAGFYKFWSNGQDLRTFQELRRLYATRDNSRGKRPHDSAWAAVYWHIGAKKNLAELLRRLTGLVEAARLPPEILCQQLSQLDPRTRDGESDLLDDFFIEPLVRLGRVSLRNLAELRCGHAALAVEHYRMRHGRWPRTLQDLVPAFLDEVPLDPFDGQPLRYSKFNQGIQVYSVGEDGTDEGGKLDWENMRGPRTMDFDYGPCLTAGRHQNHLKCLTCPRPRKDRSLPTKLRMRFLPCDGYPKRLQL